MNFWSGKRDSNPRLPAWEASILPLNYSRTEKMNMWSGRRDLNPRLQPWQGCTLPLSYSRLMASDCGNFWRRNPDSNWSIEVLQTSALPLGYSALRFWSGRRDLNPRLQPWQGCTLPLSYSRSVGAKRASTRSRPSRQAKFFIFGKLLLKKCQKWLHWPILAPNFFCTPSSSWGGCRSHGWPCHRNDPGNGVP